MDEEFLEGQDSSMCLQKECHFRGQICYIQSSADYVSKSVRAEVLIQLINEWHGPKMLQRDVEAVS